MQVPGLMLRDVRSNVALSTAHPVLLIKTNNAQAETEYSGWLASLFGVLKGWKRFSLRSVNKIKLQENNKFNSYRDICLESTITPRHRQEGNLQTGAKCRGNCEELYLEQ